MKTVFLSSASALIIAAALTASAQSQENVTVLDRLVVQATKRVQDVFDVAATIEAADAQGLRKKSVTSVGQLDKVFAGTSIKPRSSRAYTNVTIRGQSSVDFYNPSAQLYVDGLPQDQALMSQLLPAGLESIELLYGPQGTLYGRGAIGGVINVITRKPDNTFSAEGTATLHTLGGDASARVNVPLVPGVLYGDLALTFRKENDEYKVLGTGEGIGGTTDVNGRARLRYAPDDSPWDIMFTAQHGRIKSTEEQFVMQSMVEDRIAVPVPSHYILETTSLGMSASYDLGFATITSLTGYQDRDFDRTIFGSYTPEKQSTLSQELRIASNPGHDGALDYVFGIYGQRLDFERRVPAFAMVSQQTIDSLALFGDLTWHVTDRLDITPGLRFDYEKAKAHAVGGVSLNSEASFSALSPKLGATFALNNEWRLHALYSTGFKAGGFTRNVAPANITFTYDPQHTHNGEIGVKYRAEDGRLTASLAAYYNVTSDYQMFVGVQPFQYLQNVGEVTAKGLDFSVQMRPTERLKIDAALGLNRTTFTEYRNIAAPGINFTGNAVPYAPELTANLSVEYTFDLANGWGQLAPRIGVTYASSIFFDETNTIGQKGFALVDVGASWALNDKVVADIFVNNVFDKTYAVYGFSTPRFGNLYQLGQGRSFGGRINLTF